MNVIFMGTPDFAVPCLEKLIEKHNVIAVFSQPDKPVGRKQILTPPAVKKCANEHKIDVFQPNSLKDNDIIKQIEDMNADIIVVVAYGKILPKRVLEAAKYGCINVHASLLPKYRGAAPIQWSVINGDKETGVTIMQMDEGLDTGDILLVKKTNIDVDETSEELFDRLSARWLGHRGGKHGCIFHLYLRHCGQIPALEYRVLPQDPEQTAGNEDL